MNNRRDDKFRSDLYLVGAEFFTKNVSRHTALRSLLGITTLADIFPDTIGTLLAIRIWEQFYG